VISYKYVKLQIKEKVAVELKIEDLRKICVPENFEITMHAAKRLEQRNISIKYHVYMKGKL